MDEQFLVRLAKQLAILSITISVLKSELIILKKIDHEYLDAQVRDNLNTPDGRVVYEAMLLALRGK